MKKLLALLLMPIAIGTTLAQSLVPIGDGVPLRRTSRDNEIGLRYAVQVGVSGGEGVGSVDMQYVAFDYARYNFHNIGFRTGLNWFVSNIAAGQYASVPMQFTWRSGRLANKSLKYDLHGHYYNGQFYPDKDYGTLGAALGDVFLSYFPPLPSVVELHTGITPGMLLGSLNPSGADSYGALRRFTCTADVGGRLNLPIGRFRIFLDITYHCYLTRNFYNEVSKHYLGRSFVDVGGGIACNF